MLKQIVFVALGGASGSVLRFLITVMTAKFYWGVFPLATLLANITGCLLIGVFAGFANGYFDVNSNLRLLLITGFCGGYTTFSAFAFENLNLIQYQHYVVAAIYTLLSVFLGFLAVWIGLQLSSS